MNETILDGVPELPALYRQALGLAVRRRMGMAKAPATVPVARHRVDHIGVDVAQLTRFQHLLGSAARDQLPSVYLHTVAFPVAMSVLARPDFPLPLLGMVHLSNEVHQVRRVSSSEKLDVVAHAENLRAHTAGTQVDLVAEVSVDEEPVWTGRSVYLARGIRLGDRGPAVRTPDRPVFAAPVPTGVWRFGADAGRRYAGVSGDWNPIHLSSVSARALGMKRAIAHGMYLAALMVDQAVAAPSGALRWRIDFATPVLLPGVVDTAFGTTASGTAQGRVDVVGWSRSRNRPHFTGWVRAD